MLTHAVDADVEAIFTGRRLPGPRIVPTYMNYLSLKRAMQIGLCNITYHKVGVGANPGDGKLTATLNRKVNTRNHTDPNTDITISHTQTFRQQPQRIVVRRGDSRYIPQEHVTPAMHDDFWTCAPITISMESVIEHRKATAAAFGNRNSDRMIRYLSRFRFNLKDDFIVLDKKTSGYGVCILDDNGFVIYMMCQSPYHIGHPLLPRYMFRSYNYNYGCQWKNMRNSCIFCEHMEKKSWNMFISTAAASMYGRDEHREETGRIEARNAAE